MLLGTEMGAEVEAEVGGMEERNPCDSTARGCARDIPKIRPGAGIMEVDDRQVTTVQPSFHHRHSTNQVS